MCIRDRAHTYSSAWPKPDAWSGPSSLGALLTVADGDVDALPGWSPPPPHPVNARTAAVQTMRTVSYTHLTLPTSDPV